MAATYLLFDSLHRSNPFIQKDLGAGPVWVPNDNFSNASGSPYQPSRNLIQSPSRYRVFYNELNIGSNARTLEWLREHCKEQPANLTVSVENCFVMIPGGSMVRRTDEVGNVYYTNISNEPYLFVKLATIDHAEGGLVYTNNPAGNDATFVIWGDQVPCILDDPPVTDPVPRPTVSCFDQLEPLINSWSLYSTCMDTVMRINMQAEEWIVRIYDRFGNDVVAVEADNGGAGYADQPSVNPDVQTSILVGVRPNYTPKYMNSPS